MPDRALLDTNMIIDFVNKKPNALDLDVFLRQYDCSVSVITKLELLGYPEITDREKNDILAFLSRLPVLPITESIENETIEIRCKTNLELPDAIITATAIVSGATLITRDDDLLKANFPGLKAQSVIDASL